MGATGVHHGTPISQFEGKTSKVHSFSTLFASMAMLLHVCLLMCFAVSAVSHQLPMVSVPLGFQLSASDAATVWVSQNGLFAFGFLELEGYLRNDYDNGNADGFAVGVRYNLGKKSANVPVWTLAGGLRVSDNSTFKLSLDGALLLLDNSNDLILWSSNTSNLGVQKATLLDNGNLVLLGSEDQVLWQSFNNPTSTLLPGQSFHFPQSLRAPSTKSLTSFYNFVIRRSGELELLWEANVSYWKSGPMSFSIGNAIEARFDSEGVLGVYDDKNKRIWSIASKDFEDSSASLRHLRIDTDGNLRIYSWNNGLKTWKVGWQAVDNQCEVFGSCGLYSLCGFNSTGPICSCLDDGSTSENTDTQGSLLDNSGCRKLADLDNCKLRTSMMVLKHTVLYGLYPPHDSDVMLNENDCKEYCSNDTSCTAATSKNDGSGLCTVKRTSFISGYIDPSQPAISFLKECLVPQAVSARKANPQGNAEAASLPSGKFIAHVNSSKFVSAIALIGLTTTSVFITVQILAVWLVYQRRKSYVKSRIPFPRDAPMNPHYSALIRLTFEEIKELTNHFAYQLGPTIFKGLLPNRTPIIAKLLFNVILSEKDFRTAISVLGGIHHRNLVALKGFCYEQTQKVLIYEYVPQGTLDKWLFGSEIPYGQRLQERLDIALGVARALAYLHLECQTCIPHGSLKLENIMLDESLVPKLMDFGLQGLLQEEAASSSESLSERDIYHFGVILLQIATCRRDPLGNDEFDNMVKEIFDTQRFKGPEECERVERMVKIAFWCVQSQPFLRPSIGEVVKVLEGALSVDRPPSTLAFRSAQQEGAQEIEEHP